MKQIKPEDIIGYADYIKIVFADKCVEVFLGNERCLNYPFDEVLQEAKQNGWKDRTVMLIAETPLSGKIYMYGNYGPFWVEYGETRGYA